MKNDRLRIDYDQILSDMLVMQYRVEVFRRKMQQGRGIVGNVQTSKLSELIDEAIDNLVGIQGDDLLRVDKDKKWWIR
jgi:hypothetical protein